jgi:hypothetical protein
VVSNYYCAFTDCQKHHYQQQLASGRSLPLANLADNSRVMPPTFGLAPHVRNRSTTILVLVHSYNNYKRIEAFAAIIVPRIRNEIR